MAAASIQRAVYEASGFSYRGVSLRKRLNQEWVASTTQRRALKAGSFSSSRFSSPCGRICGTKPWARTSPSLPSVIRSFSRGSNITLSCRLAPLTASDKGTPRSSTNTLRLLPFFSPIRRIGANRFPRQWRFDVGTVGSLPMPRYALHIVVFRQSFQPQVAKESGPCPLLELVMKRGRAQSAEFFSGQGVPDGACTQDIDHGGKGVRLEYLGFLPPPGRRW